MSAKVWSMADLKRAEVILAGARFAVDEWQRWEKAEGETDATKREQAISELILPGVSHRDRQVQAKDLHPEQYEALRACFREVARVRADLATRDLTAELGITLSCSKAILAGAS